jgi:predicted transcriptional regulator
MKYRSRIDIISQILDAAKSGAATKTKMMYQAYLSFTQMKEYLMVLTENGLLSYDFDTRTFKTTQKGFGFLDAYNRIGDMIKTPARRPPPQ